MASDIDNIIPKLVERARQLIHEAFDAGRAAGRQEGSNEFRSKLANLFGPIDIEPSSVSRTVVLEPPRAIPGSVKPRILEMVRAEPGLTAKEIESRTDIKYNSVRGTLWTLKVEKKVQQKNGRWYPKENEAADLLSGRASAASDPQQH